MDSTSDEELSSGDDESKEEDEEELSTGQDRSKDKVDNCKASLI